MGYKYEMHLHTSESSLCGRSSAAEMVRAHAKAGYAGIVVTDHFLNGNSAVPRDLSWEEKMRMYYHSFELAFAEGEKLDLDVFFGIEFGYPPFGKEFLTYGVDLNFLLSNPDLLEIPIEEYSRRVRDYGGYIAQAHPYREAGYIDNSKLPKPDIIDGVEVFNFGNFEAEWNDKALEFAKQNNLGFISGTDTHSVDRIGHAGIEFPYRLHTAESLVKALKNREGKLIINGEVTEIN